jgi:hypothetical protein
MEETGKLNKIFVDNLKGSIRFEELCMLERL